MNTLAGVAFLGLLGLHVTHALIRARRTSSDPKSNHTLTTIVTSAFPFLVVCRGRARPERPRVTVTVIAQMLLFAMACGFAARQGVLTRALVSPVYIGLGLLAGHLIFGVSLLITQRSVRDVAGYLVDLGPAWSYLVEHPAILMQYLTVSVAEELIYRVGAQPLVSAWAGSTCVGLLAVAIVFACVHEHFFRNPVGQSAEFLGFSILLGALYYWTGSLILVIVVHAVRNLEIAFLEHLIRVEEAGGEESADREAAFDAGHRMLVVMALPAGDWASAAFEYTPELPGWGAPPLAARPCAEPS